MRTIDRFLEHERTHAGWRFWLLFVIMTNVGFFPGLALERALFGEVNVLIATTFSGMEQAWVLSRHFPERGQWAIASAGGWFVGGLLSTRILAILVPEISFTLNLFVFPLIAGAVMGVPLWLVLRRYLPQVGWWWVVISAVGPAIQFPGMVMGGAIVWLMSHSDTPTPSLPGTANAGYEVYRARDTERRRDVVPRVLRLTLALVVLASSCARSGPSTGVTIEAVTVIDAVNGVRENQRVVTDGDLIVSVTEMSEPTPPTAETLDGSGRFLIPGLWDMHVHFLYDYALTSAMAGLFLRCGITSVRDTGGDLARMTALRAGLDASDVPAPRVFLSGPLLDGRRVVYDGGDPDRPALGTSVPDAESARQQVRLLKEAGADFIKIYELVEPEVFGVLVDEARRLGLPIASHVPLTMTADVAGPLVDSMEHLRNIELACAASWQELLEVRRRRIDEFGDGRGIELRSELHALQRRPAVVDFDEARCDDVLGSLRDTTQVPTLRLNLMGMVRIFDRPDWTPALAELPGVVRDRWQARADQTRHAGPPEEDTFAEWSQFLTSKLKTRGVPIGAGTDTPIGLAIPGYALHTELELLVESGLTPLEALYAATVQPASFFGLEAEMGQVQAGMRADLVLLDGNPLADIRNTRRIVNVMSRGVWLE